eukprot:1158802-Pelagomonas_calceolata.AAC.10
MLKNLLAPNTLLRRRLPTLITKVRQGVLLVTLLIPIDLLIIPLGEGDTWCLSPRNNKCPGRAMYKQFFFYFFCLLLCSAKGCPTGCPKEAHQVYKLHLSKPVHEADNPVIQGNRKQLSVPFTTSNKRAGICTAAAYESQ